MVRSKNISLTENDRIWINNHFPNLKYNSCHEFNLLSGYIEINGYYNKITDEFIHNPPTSYTGKYKIEDRYKIKVDFQDSSNAVLPKVKEIGGRIKEVSNKKHIALCDLHINKNDTTCLCGNHDQLDFISNGFKIDKFLWELVIPFFYDQSFFEKYNEWPRGTLSHGVPGERENLLQRFPKLRLYIDNDKKYSRLLKLFKAKKIKQNWKCICMSGRRFCDCHKEFLELSRTEEFKKLKKMYKLTNFKNNW